MDGFNEMTQAKLDAMSDLEYFSLGCFFGLLIGVRSLLIHVRSPYS